MAKESLEFENPIQFSLQALKLFSEIGINPDDTRYSANALWLDNRKLLTERNQPLALVAKAVLGRMGIHNETTYGKWENTITSVITGIEARFWSPKRASQNNKPLGKASFNALRTRNKNEVNEELYERLEQNYK